MTITPTPIQISPRPTEPSPPHRRSKARVVTAAIAVILLALGAGALFLLRDGSDTADEPVPTASQEDATRAISVDSLEWTRISLGTEGPSLAITRGGPGLVGVGMYHEPDPEDLSDGGGGPGWVQGYRDIPTVWTSPDGYKWSRVPDDSVFDVDVEIEGIAAGETGLVAVGQHYVWTSPDGMNWTRVADDAFGRGDWLRGVIAGGPGFVAFGEHGTRAAVWTSADGLAWIAVDDAAFPAASGVSVQAMTVGGPGLVAVGFDATTSNPVVWTSLDGSAWTRVPHDPAAFGEGDPAEYMSGARIEGVTIGSSGLVAVGSEMTETSSDELGVVAVVWTSTDGVTWTRVPHDPNLFGGPEDAPFAMLWDVAAVGDGFVAIGSSGEASMVLTSHDGVSWTRTADPVLDAVERTGMGHIGMEQVIAAGDSVVILGNELIEDYGASNRPPLIGTNVWVGSRGEG